jgi:hypothetical protein
MLGFGALGAFPLGGIPPSARTDVLTAASGSYAVTGNASYGSYGEAAQSGSYVITGNAAGMALAAGSGSYTLTGSDASASRAVGPGSYAVTGNEVLFAATFVAESGSYTLTLGEYTLRRTGDDIEPGVYGIGHIKLAMEEARRLSRVVKPTPYPVISRPPRLVPQLAAPIIPSLPIGGLIDNSNLLDHMAAQRQQMAAQQATEAQQQARRRAVAVLLLAA